MARLLGVEQHGPYTEKWWLHTGDDGKDRITIETIQDVEPIFKSVKIRSQGETSKDLKLIASIPGNIINEVCRVNAAKWGIRPSEVMAELVKNRTDRSKATWKMLTQGRDFRKLQAQHYAT